MKEFKKTGYLNNDFKIFHLIDQGMAPVNFHFHEFHKILILLKGNVSYCIEGRSYDLQPDDDVLVVRQPHALHEVVTKFRPVRIRKGGAFLYRGADLET